MSPQLSLFGEPDRATDRLLLVFYPERNAALQIDQLRNMFKRSSMLTGPQVDLERLHMTLAHIGDYIGLPQGVVNASIEAASRVLSSSFEIVLDRAISFAGKPGVLRLCCWPRRAIH